MADDVQPLLAALRHHAGKPERLDALDHVDALDAERLGAAQHGGAVVRIVQVLDHQRAGRPGAPPRPRRCAPADRRAAAAPASRTRRAGSANGSPVRPRSIQSTQICSGASSSRTGSRRSWRQEDVAAEGGAQLGAAPQPEAERRRPRLRHLALAAVADALALAVVLAAALLARVLGAAHAARRRLDAVLAEHAVAGAAALLRRRRRRRSGVWSAATCPASAFCAGLRAQAGPRQPGSERKSHHSAGASRRHSPSYNILALARAPAASRRAVSFVTGPGQ